MGHLRGSKGSQHRDLRESTVSMEETQGSFQSLECDSSKFFSSDIEM